MARLSNKENKTMYQIVRENLGLSREKASTLLVTITPERLERIENEKFDVTPDEVLLMSKVYKCPKLCNYYCSNKCSIGKKYINELEVVGLEKIVLQVISSVNNLNKNKDLLIDIASDGKISDNEIDDFVNIKKELEKISNDANILNLWIEEMILNGNIDGEKLNG